MTWMRASVTASSAREMCLIASGLVSRGSPLNSACEITCIVAAVAEAAMSRRSGCHSSAADCATLPKTGTSASTAGGVKLAETIFRCLRHSSPSELSRPWPIVGWRICLTSLGLP